MRYRNIIITLGFLTLILSTGIVGVPESWTTSAMRLSCLAIIVLAYLGKRD